MAPYQSVFSRSEPKLIISPKNNPIKLFTFTARRFSSASSISRGFGVSRFRFLAPGSDGSSLGSSSLKMEGTFLLLFLRVVGLSDAFGIESARIQKVSYVLL